MGSVLKFEASDVVVAPDFWQDVAKLKLDLGLQHPDLEVQGYSGPCTHQIPVPLQLTQSSFSNNVMGRNQCPAPGRLHITNTLEDYESHDLNKFLEEEADKIWSHICSGKAEQDCKVLNRFMMICFADLKVWKFHHSCYFPALEFSEPVLGGPVRQAFDYFAPEEHPKVISACKGWRQSLDTSCLPFFLLHFSAVDVSARPLSEWSECKDDKVILCFYDPCHKMNPGWPLRNFLMLAAVRWGLKDATILCWREMKGKADLKLCLVMDVQLPQVHGDKRPRVVACGPPRRVHDISSIMEPERLAVSAADLNLKLMKWRHLKSLEFEKLSTTRCLIIGAGTLGCEVARGLLGWGIRDITFVDRGRVGFSNPPRQSLYQYRDCLNGGRFKAEAAAEALRNICVDVRSRGVQLSIPMPGHPVEGDQVEITRDDFSNLEREVQGHDIIFILTDTRESRWLPTLLCAASDEPKVLLNAALGFDSYLVMRHGDGPLYASDDTRLGCYFCNDVVAPKDSTANQTLDQQCTVSVPGLASIAATLAVHMAISILHHPLGNSAPADKRVPALNENIEQPLGILPHQIRGFLSHCTQLPIFGSAYDRCTACSYKIVSELKQRGFEFVLEALNDAKYLENVSGLTDLLEATKSISLEDFDVEEDSDVDAIAIDE